MPQWKRYRTLLRDVKNNDYTGVGQDSEWCSLIGPLSRPQSTPNNTLYRGAVSLLFFCAGGLHLRIVYEGAPWSSALLHHNMNNIIVIPPVRGCAASRKGAGRTPTPLSFRFVAPLLAGPSCHPAPRPMGARHLRKLSWATPTNYVIHRPVSYRFFSNNTICQHPLQ